MNILIILIMGVLFTTYQYFTAEKSMDNSLNKDELKLQAELNCMKQFHNLASTKIETPSLSDSENGVSLRENSTVEYSCSSNEDIDVYKYCLNSVGAKILCIDTNTYEHCVSTTKHKKFLQSEAYLTAQIIKAGISITVDGKIGTKDVVFVTEAPEKLNTTDMIQSIGMISCMSQDEVDRRAEALKAKCDEGLYISLDEFGNIITDEEGEPVCSPLPSISPCTAHEIESTSATSLANCTSVGQVMCCPNQDLELNCKGDTEKVWKSQLRFFVCDNGSDYCTSETGSMLVQDEQNNLIKTISISDAFTANYIDTSATFACNPISNKFVEECKAQTSSNYGYLGVENIRSNIAISTLNTTGYTPICRLSAKEHSNAVQNCSVCEEAEFSTEQQRWMCASKTWTQINSLSNKISYINTLAGINAGYTEKGLKGCFASCTDDQLTQIKSGVRNGANWGLEWNTSTKTWGCFQCDYETAYNNTCSDCTKGMDHINDCNCNDQTTQGKCVPHDCSTSYQTLIDGQCYTKWCNRSILPDNVEVNSPMINTCPVTASWMVYNEQKTCVYCVRTTPDRIE